MWLLKEQMWCDHHNFQCNCFKSGLFCISFGMPFLALPEGILKMFLFYLLVAACNEIGESVSVNISPREWVLMNLGVWWKTHMETVLFPSLSPNSSVASWLKLISGLMLSSPGPTEFLISGSPLVVVLTCLEFIHLSSYIDHGRMVGSRYTLYPTICMSSL